MTEELKNKLDSFVKFIIGKIDKKDLPDIQKNYDELIEFYQKFSILTDEDFEKMVKEFEESQEQIKTYEAQKEIDADKIKSMKVELANNMDLKEKYKKLNEEYNTLKQKI